MRLLLCSFIALTLFSCSNDKPKTPDVSEVKVDLSTKRFEREFFSIDTNHLMEQLTLIVDGYPGFGKNFLYTILAVDTAWPAPKKTEYLKGFIAYNKSVYDAAEQTYPDFSSYEKEIKHGLQFVKHYFPNYKAPTKIITYIGPADGYGDLIDVDAFMIGLHAHLGKDFPLYKTTQVQETYPAYVSARFSPDYIAINCMKNVVLDMYPEKSEDKRLIVQMIEKGKRLYLLSKFLPETPENKLIGYTDEQMKDAYSREAAIWNLFIQNNTLQVADNNVIKNYVSEGPKTQELGEKSPGNIGSFAGWQIVKKYMDKHPELQPQGLMNTDDEKIYQEAKYKP